jgi:calcineurin-like phosphoesterase family protein
MPELFFTADTHWGHAGIMIHCKRKFIKPGDLDEHGRFLSYDTMNSRVKEMDETMISNWNSVVHRNDKVYILGDFAWKHHSHYLGALKGKKILIRGNHDEMSQDELKLFTEVYDMRLVPLPMGKKAFCCHFAMTSWPSSWSGVYMFHGHSHGRIKEVPGVLRCDVGVDVWDFAPVRAEVLITKMEEFSKTEVVRFLGEGDLHAEENRERNGRYMNGKGIVQEKEEADSETV